MSAVLQQFEPTQANAEARSIQARLGRRSEPLYAEGLRHPVWEMFSESCGPSLRTFRNGKVGLDLDEDIEVSAEGAADFVMFMAWEKAAEPITDRTQWLEGYCFYLALGTVTPAKGQSRKRNGLHGNRTLEELAAHPEFEAFQ